MFTHRNTVPFGPQAGNRKRATTWPGGSQTIERPLIYVVDDLPDMTELYASLLEEAAYRVKTFHDRAAALAALISEEEKPALLITDFRGLSISIITFIRESLAIHPPLRILMATGFHRTDSWLSMVKDHRFLRKPFSLEELQQEVEASLTGSFVSLQLEKK